jgi:hypothetical protein
VSLDSDDLESGLGKQAGGPFTPRPETEDHHIHFGRHGVSSSRRCD